MARLNEPPAAPAAATTTSTGESVDALRRRFIRQNRELARNNSSQSLKIRSLELEVSRLLADNLELRNRELRLQHEVALAQRHAARRLKADLREKFEAWMGEVDGGEEDGTEADNAQEAKERKPLEGNWRERQPLSEIMRDTQMPTIQEDKQYPRRTIGADEIQAVRLSDHSNESPDLGPPPVAHFDYDNAGDPVKHPSPLGNKASLLPTDKAEDEDGIPANLSVNLETRRKRKDGQPKTEVRRRSLMPPPSPEKECEQPSAILRTGAKRKLADREAERPIKPPSKGDFTFSRRSGGDEAKPAVTDERHQQTENQEKPARKVLGDKSVNMSPRKAAPAAETTAEKPDKGRPVKPAASRFQSAAKGKSEDKEAAPTRRRRQSSIPVPAPQDEEPQVLETVEIPPPQEPVLPTPDLHPKTPAAMDLFSPTPSEPSARHEGRSGTPPPGDLSTMSIATDGGTRPSRRARAAVNYAEPSLNAKMRRPGKQMVDAISGLQHHSRAMSSLDRSAGSASRSSIVVKAEPGEEEDADARWRDLPPAHLSPLGEKSGGPPAAIETESDPAPPSSAPARSRKRRESGQQQQSRSRSTTSSDLEAAVQKMEEMDLYEFKDSSSPRTNSGASKIGKAGVGRRRSMML